MSIEKVKILRVSSTDKKKDGSELIGKYGKFYRVGIQTEQHGEKWLNGFMSKEPTFQAGDEITIDTSTEEWQGQEQLKFRIPKPEDIESAEKDAEIEELKKQLENKVEETDGGE